MNKRITKDADELRKIVEYFNSFHDGFLKSVKIISGSTFSQHPLWEKPEKYQSNAEKLCDTGLYMSEKKGMFIEIHHYNYDWPNKPPDNKIILYLKNVRDVNSNILRMVGESIIDCKTLSGESGLGLIFTFEIFANSRWDKVQLEPLEFEKISIEEKS